MSARAVRIIGKRTVMMGAKCGVNVPGDKEREGKKISGWDVD